MTAYILQVVFFQLLFLLVYEVLLKKETFFTWNRWYLLLTALIALILPFLKIEGLALLVPREPLAGVTNILLPEVLIGEQPQNIKDVTAISVSDESTGINWWLVAYGIGLCGSLFLLIRKYQHLNRLFKYRIISAEKDLRIIEVPDSSIACTFYRTIFLGNKLTEAEKLQILSHELVHVKQKHSLDLLFFEVLKIVSWFNPLVYIYQNRMAAVHEFIADASVVKSTPKKSYYEQLLNSAFNTTNISFINQFFNHSLIKKRIVMLQKSRSKSTAKLKYLVMIPLMLAMLTYVACSDDKTVEEINFQTDAADDAALKAALWEEITAMDARGVEFSKIADDFLLEMDAHIKSKEAYYRMQTFMRLVHQKTVEREKAAGTYDENSKNPFHSVLDVDYDEYVANQKQKETVKRQIPADSNDDTASVPFAVIEEVPVFPGCEDLGSNEEQKKCMSEKVAEYVAKNFDTGLGKKLGLTGVNRVIAIFKISPEGKVTDVRARAPHPDLEVEAKRVIEGLPNMIPGKQGGKEVGVSYSLPIVFQIGE